MVECCQKIADALLSRRTPMQGLNLLSLGIRCLQGNNTKLLTGLHAILLELCLSGTCFKAAFPYVADDIDEFSSEVIKTQSLSTTVRLKSFESFNMNIFYSVKRSRCESDSSLLLLWRNDLHWTQKIHSSIILF